MNMYGYGLSLCKFSALRDQKKVSDILELGLLAIVIHTMWLLEAKSGSSVRVIHSLNH